MARLWAKEVSYDSVQVEDEFPILVKHESQESIDLYSKYAPIGPRPDWRSLHTDEEYSKGGIFGGTVSSGPATVAYVAELLEKAFAVTNLMGRGSTLEMRATEPVRAGDTITFTGRVTGKREEGSDRLIDCEIIGTNQLDQVVARARASVSFPL